jgi:general stress protein YciG
MRKFEMAQDKQQGSMSVNEAGKKGGDATSASHDKEFYQEIGSKGGQNSGGNFANDRDRASEAGSKGGQSSGGNFANDREKASEAGHKGGQNSHGGGRNS